MTRRLPHRIAAGAVAAAVAASALIASAPAAAAPAIDAPTSGDVDYFADRVEGLREGSVFETATFERFQFLLNSGDRIAVVLGGPGDGRFDAAAAAIDAAAVEAGIDTVIAFDPRLDGDSVDIRTDPNAAYSKLWDDLVANSLNQDPEPLFDTGAWPENDPFVFVFDGDRQVGGLADRVVAALPAPDGAETGFGEAVEELFAAASVEEFDTSSQFDFLAGEFNRKHVRDYADASLYGGAIFDESERADFALQSVTYPELINLLEDDEEHVILFGGTWCHNTRAVVKDVNRAAVDAGVENVYVFDLRVDGASGGALHIRDTASPYAHLYGDLVEQYLPGLRTEYVTEGDRANPVAYYPGGDRSAPLIKAQKLQVPYLIQYDATLEAPIVQDWIRDNGDGTFKEYMTEWWWVEGLPGKNSRNAAPEIWAAQQRTAWDLADEGIAKIDKFFDGSVTTPSAPAKPTASVDGSAVTVSWAAPTGETGTRSTGYDVALNGGTPVRVGPEATSYTFTGLAAGDYTATVVARNGLGGSPSSPAAASVRVVAAPETPGSGQTPTPAPSQPLPETTEPRELQLAVSGDLRPGGRIEVIGSGYDAEIPSVRVELHSTPSLLGNATIAADGTFRLAATIPSDVPAGAHSVVVYAGGVEVSRTAVTVAAAPGTALAETGANAAAALGLGALALLALGTALVTRRRRIA